MKKLLVVGKNSFLASHFIARNVERFAITAVSHGDSLNALDMDSFDGIVNMAYDPSYFKTPYAVEKDYDLHVARAVQGKRPQFFMMSTRKVYGLNPPFPVSEDTALEATDFYGANKAKTEVAIQSLLGGACTILRIANVFGEETGRHTFFGIALANLKKHGRILLDVSPFTQRDFLPVESFSDILGDTIQLAPQGTFNLGSGKALPVGQIALWLIEGFGSGELVVNAPGERDGFLLNSSKLYNALGYKDAFEIDIRTVCLDIGRRLKDA